MKASNVCIIVAAQGISKKTIQRFKESIYNSKPTRTPTILVRSGKEKKFYKTKILNRCLRDMMPKFEYIIQTDIDLIVPPGLINQTCNALKQQPNNCYHHFLRYVDPSEIKGKRYGQYPWSEWINLKADFCSGCWNGMTSKTWKQTGGYNEQMFAWGAEDTEFYNRTRRKGIRWMNKKSFALVHINHPRRQQRRQKENFASAQLFSDETNWLTGHIVRKTSQ